MFLETVLKNRWIPRKYRDGIFPRQAQFLAYEGREAMYGGAAGGGKSFGLLMAALQYVDVPGYHALILRRTFKQLAKPEAIMSVAEDWLTGSGAKWNAEGKRWLFPSGATLTFGHMEHDRSVHDYQGSAYAYVGYDELTQFKEPMYRYLFSRMRRAAGSQTPLRMRSGSNPGGIGHQWAYKRFIDHKTRRQSALFIPATLDDNTGIDREDYVASLAELDPVTRAQLLAGDWNVHEGGRFQPHWFRSRYRLVNTHFGQGGEYELGEGGRRVLASSVWKFMTVDPAASSMLTAKSADPDYTVASVWGVTPDWQLLWLDCDRFRAEVPDIVPRLESLYSLHGPLYIGVEAVAANRAVLQLAQRTRMVVRELSPRGQDKLVRATPALNLAASGRVWLPVAAHWLEDVEAELYLFTGGSQDAHDDSVDSLAYAASALEEFGDPSDDGLPMVLGQRYQ